MRSRPGRIAAPFDLRSFASRLTTVGISRLFDILTLSNGLPPPMHAAPPFSPCLSLLRLEIIQQHVPLLALLAPVPHNDTAAVDDLARIALAIQHAQARPLAQHLAVGHLDERDLMFGAQRDDELLVRLFLAAFVQDAHVSLAAVKGFGRFAETARKAIVDEGELEDTCLNEANVSGR